eukprot:gene9965-20724_t
MGATASTLPSMMNEHDAMRLCGPKYDREKFNALKNDEGFITKEDFLHAITTSQEKEVFDLFMAYCPKGEMESRTFVKLFREAKLLNKKDMTAQDADIMYKKILLSLLNTAKKLNYYHFRNDAIPMVAAKKNMNVDQIMHKLSRVEAPTGTTNLPEIVRLHDNPAITSSQQRKKSYLSIQASNVSVNHELYAEMLQHTASQEAAHKILLDESDQSNFANATRRPTFPPSPHSRRGSANIVNANTVEGIVNDSPGAKRNSFQYSSSDVKLPPINGTPTATSTTASTPTTITFPVKARTGSITSQNGSISSVRNESIGSNYPSISGQMQQVNGMMTIDSSIGNSNNGNCNMDNLPEPVESPLHRHTRSIAEDPSATAVNAVIKIQTQHRGVLARKKSAAMMLIKQISHKSFNSTEFSLQSHIPEEDDVKELFELYSPNHEMTAQQFIYMLKSAKIINKRFTTGDADLVFQKTKAKASNTTGGTIAKGVIMGKRINFEVFRAVAVPELAERSMMSDWKVGGLHTNQLPEVLRTEIRRKSVATGEHIANYMAPDYAEMLADSKKS